MCLRVAASAVLFLTVFAECPVVAAEPRPLNVLFIMSDDMRPELGCYGNKQIRTPNLDALAGAGVRFDQAHVQYPLCNPSRTSLLTGRYPSTSGVMDNSTSFRKDHPDWVSLPQFFKNNGYASLRSGKIYHGGIDDLMAWTEGGDKPPAAGSIVPAPRKSAPTADRHRASDRIVVLEGDGGDFGDNKTAELAIDYLSRYKDKPFFLACGFNKPHSAPTAPRRFFDLYDPASIRLPENFAPRAMTPPGWPERAITPSSDLFINRDASETEAKEMTRAYWASISYVDWNVGRVLAELDKQGLRGNTIVLFWGDHGYHLGEWGKWSKHNSLIDIGTRVPLIIQTPGSKNQGATVRRIVQTLDLYPTLADLCGLKAPAGLEGKSLRPLLDDPSAEWSTPAITLGGSMTKFGVAVRTEKHRYVEYDNGADGVMLFDHEKDPWETRNLADAPELREVRQELATIARKHAPKPVEK